MSIDEAIAKYKEITNTDAICPAHCNISCDNCVKESRQLAEWLQELKELRTIRVRQYKGEDMDLLNVLKENYDYLPQILSQESFGLYIDEYAEQLKAGVKE